ncbi:MAG: hypothetical protein V7642_3856 [Burkholderiales bacterium]|jgi:predicted Zn finger-like uncharacterized protein
MALATRCPHCKTTFRVANDQLKLRAGLVRCGACKEIFNGIEHLLRPDSVEPRTAAPAPQSESATQPEPAPVAESTPAAKPAVDLDADNRDIASFLTPPRPAAEPETPGMQAAGPTEDEATRPIASSRQANAAPAYDSSAVDPLQRMTLVDFSYADDDHGDESPPAEKPKTQPNADEPDPLEQAIEDLQRKPLRAAKKSSRKKRHHTEEEDTEAEEPSFVKQGRRRERFGRSLHVFMGVASVFLLLGLLAQSTYVFRDQLAVWFPKAKPAVAMACKVLHCQVGLPAQIEAVSIESSELQAVAPERNIFALTVLLRNHGATTQAWPNIELTLNDANEKPIARRVFMPRDYLGAQPDLTGFTSKSEQSFKVFFELLEIKASGYRVYLFYP